MDEKDVIQRVHPGVGVTSSAAAKADRALISRCVRAIQTRALSATAWPTLVIDFS